MTSIGTITNAETGEVLSKVLSTLVIRGIGGFGYPGKIKISYPDIPKR